MFVEINKISKTYITKGKKTIANRDITITIKEGEFIGLFGSNGSGKTTLIRECLGIVSPDTGEIRVNGKVALKGVMDYATDVGYMSQAGYAALYSLRVKEAVEIVAKLKDIAIETAYARLEEVVTQFQMSKNFTNKYLFQLSGGQRRVIYFFLAIINNPKFLVLDEPSNDLDPDKRYHLWNTIEKMNKKGTTIVLVTHSIAEIEDKISKVIFMKDGEVKMNEEKSTLITSFKNKKRVSIFFKEALTENEVELLKQIFKPYYIKQLDVCSFVLIVDKDYTNMQDMRKIDKFIGYNEREIGLEDICFATN